MKECVTHHYACDCREAKFAALMKAARPFYAAIYNDNGDITTSTGHISTRDWRELDAAMKALEETEQ